MGPLGVRRLPLIAAKGVIARASGVIARASLFGLCAGVVSFSVLADIADTNRPIRSGGRPL